MNLYVVSLGALQQMDQKLTYSLQRTAEEESIYEAVMFGLHFQEKLKRIYSIKKQMKQRARAANH